MSYIPNTEDDRRAMLETIGVADVQELFADIPAAHRFPAYDLPPALSEAEMLREVRALAEANADADHLACFRGAGAYNHFVPGVVRAIVSRGEFATTYTPYQPEVSQGTLQAHFEYQSMLVALTGMDAANVSHYDGATAVAEAVVMALKVREGRASRVVLSPTLPPMYRAVVRTYLQGVPVEIVDDLPRGDVSALIAAIDAGTACVVVANPDFLGRLYAPDELRPLADAVHAVGGLLAVSVDPISLGVVTPPGAYSADVVTGEGQSLGNDLNFGGPYLGLFATRTQYVRKSAGRIVGETTDCQGRRGYVLTLSTREQHIRREKASSNICSNEALNALAAAVYLAAMGKTGLRRVAELCWHKAHYAAERLGALPGFRVEPGLFFKEFVLHCPSSVAALNRRLRAHGILGGYPLGEVYPDLDDAMLVCVTELNTRAEIDRLADVLAGG
jgi:glycine dehydrogenase subunit 1